MKMIITDSVIYTANILKNGGIAAFPTETVYGLGANVYDEKAISKIFKAKGRPADNPLIVHIAHKKHLEILAREIPEYARKIIRQFFPGPIALIFKKNEIIPDMLQRALWIQQFICRHQSALNLIQKCGFPIAALINLSGSPSPTSFVHVFQFKG
jgi:L-threonylcarbamoyladenylate synthase